MWIQKNENPINNRVGDCVIRAISTALGQSWVTTYADLCVEAFIECDLMSSNYIWGKYLSRKGYKRHSIPNDCRCYTVEDFCKDHPQGTYILGTGTHCVCAKDGCFFDSWNSSQECPIYYFTKDEE